MTLTLRDTWEGTTEATPTRATSTMPGTCASHAVMVRHSRRYFGIAFGLLEHAASYSVSLILQPLHHDNRPNSDSRGILLLPKSVFDCWFCHLESYLLPRQHLEEGPCKTLDHTQGQGIDILVRREFCMVAAVTRSRV